MSMHVVAVMPASCVTCYSLSGQGGGQDGRSIQVPCACSILAQTAAYSPAAWSAIMEGSGLLGFLVGLFGGLLGCLLVFLMQRPGTPKQGTSASDEAEDSKDRIQAAPAHGEGQAVPGTSSPPSDSKGPKDDDDKDAGSRIRPRPHLRARRAQGRLHRSRTARPQPRPRRWTETPNSRTQPSCTSRTGWRGDEEDHATGPPSTPG